MKTLPALLIGLGCVVSVHAQSNIVVKPKTQAVSWTFSTALSSEYLARPGFSLYDEEVNQNDLSVSWKGMYAGVWNSSALRESSTFKYGQEVQIYFGYKKAYGWFTFDVNARYDILKEFGQSKDDLLMMDFRVEATKVPFIQPYVAGRYFKSVGLGEKVDDGWFIWIGLVRNQDLGFGVTEAGHLKLIADASVAHSDGALSRDAGWVYGRFGFRLVVPVTKTFSLVPQLTVQLPLDDHDVGSKPYTDGDVKVVGGIAATFKF